MAKELADNKIYLRIIYGISILIPVVVAYIIISPSIFSFSGDWVYLLPGTHAAINMLTAFFLIAALISIRNGNIFLHRTFMFTALIMGVFFLISYIIYHSSVESVKFGDIDHDGLLNDLEMEKAGSSRTIYLIILVSHILLSIVVVPFVLFAFYFALTNQIGKHKKMVRFTYPVWMYVSITGVVVYFMIQPYYL